MTDAAKIARGLAKAQREAVLRCDGDDWWGYRFANGTARGIPSELKTRSIDGSYLTPLGLAVRAELERIDHD